MSEIVQPQNLVRDQVLELFSNDTFMSYSPLFYESQKSIAQVLRELKIKGRGTINKQFKVFQKGDGYDPDYIKMNVSHRPFQKKIQFTHRIVVDLIIFYARETGQSLELTEQEINLLLEFMNLPGIDLVLRKETKSWLDVLSKLAVSMVFFIGYQEKVGQNKIFVKSLTEHVNSLTMFNSFAKNEQEAFFMDLQEFNKTAGGQISQLAKKVVNLRIPISFTSKDIYILTRGAMEAAKYGAEAVFRVCYAIEPILKRKLKAKTSRERITSMLADLGIELDF